MSKKIIQSVKGFNDIFDEQVAFFRKIEKVILSVTRQHNISEIRLPILEKSELFNRSIGNETEIVNKEMYTFQDKNKDSLSLRPEGTASCVRCAIEHNLIYDRGIKKQKFWYYGPMFRHENPQKGRYRQFHQLGIEYFGYSNSNSDIEVIMLGQRIFQNLQIENISLHINSLGNDDDKKKYAKTIEAYIKKSNLILDTKLKSTLERNPMRLLDSKNEDIKDTLKGLPTLYESLSKSSKSRIDLVLLKLDDLGIKYLIDNSIVRGLDYYNDTVFEWKHSSLGSQDAICAGGRYDSLVNQIGACDVPAIGFALGVERLIELIKEKKDSYQILNRCISIINVSAEDKSYCAAISNELRNKYPKISFHNTDSSASLSAQLKHASKLNSSYLIIIGEEEIKNSSFLIKYVNKKVDDIIVSKQELFKLMDLV